jgi:hypothetical protein
MTRDAPSPFFPGRCRKAASRPDKPVGLYQFGDAGLAASDGALAMSLVRDPPYVALSENKGSASSIGHSLRNRILPVGIYAEEAGAAAQNLVRGMLSEGRVRFAARVRVADDDG